MSAKRRRTSAAFSPAAPPSISGPHSAPGPFSSAAEARELEVLAERYPQEREEILVEAAEVWARAG
ncbi:hypothetical protein ACIQMO_24915 [Streptomyces sp. NPDC091406]|uniref:hypothetical protein n=1 Tax=unclassified Streptomyces TaxID=2593676 RepID=UPI0038177206